MVSARRYILNVSTKGLQITISNPHECFLLLNVNVFVEISLGPQMHKCMLNIGISHKDTYAIIHIGIIESVSFRCNEEYIRPCCNV